MSEENSQVNFWKNTYSKEYIRKNSDFNEDLLVSGWKQIIANIDEPSSILECGANVGRNITALQQIFPAADKSAIELSADAAAVLREKFDNLNVFNGSILQSDFSDKSFDLTFTMGVLIHIHPDDLLDNLKKIVGYSRKYVVVGEYFNRTPVSLEYHGEQDKLFKRDFGKYIIENFDDELELVDYGFLWGHLFDDGGFDDITWWVFKRKNIV